MNMTADTKSMIAGCIEKMRRGSCGTCERRDSCAFLWSRRREPARTEGRPRHPFLAMLGEVAKAIEARARPAPSTFRREVERKIEPLLASGDIGIERIARELGFSRQTLYRRLKSEGVTFEQLLDGLRRRLAIGFIQDQGLSVKETAYRLGFSDPAAFSRAFKRWTGRSPGAMRPPH
jgi:AraC-like DNA-binding protein